MDQTLIQDQITSHVKLCDPKNIGDVDVLVIFGTKEESVSRAALSWMRKGEGRFPVFVEPCEEQFLKAKQSPSFKDPKVRLLYCKTGDEEIFHRIAWEFVLLRFGYCAPQPEIRLRALEFFGHLEHYHRGASHLASDCEDMGCKVLSNIFQNLSVLPKSRLGTTLEGTCAGMTAIICGAGPSLNSLLPQLVPFKDRALLIAGGTAVRALSSWGIRPHISAHVDPGPPRKRFLEQDSFEVPLFYQSRFSHDLLQTVQAPLLWMPGSGNYPLEAWIEAEVGIFAERFDAGCSISNFCTSLAAWLGCTTLIFAGMDFSCGPEAIYAANIGGDEHAGACFVEIEKDRLYSRPDWILSAAWMGSFAKEHPHIHCLNASSTGLELPGIQRCTLSDAASFFHDTPMDLAGKIHAAVSGAPLSNVTLEKVADVVDRVKESFKKCLTLCEALLKVWEKHYPNSPLDKGEYAVLEHDLQQEICHCHFLIPLWNIWKWPILRTAFHPLGQHIHRLLFFKNALEMHLSSGVLNINGMRLST